MSNDPDAAPRPPARSRVSAEAAATQSLANAIDRLAGSVESLKPAADALGGVATMLQGASRFLTKHRMKLALSVPGVLVAIGALQPNAARALATFFSAFGAG